MLLCTVSAMFIMAGVMAQSTLDESVRAKIAKRTVAGAEMGSLICQDASGKLALCSGEIEETVMGIATNVPYVTLNKPASPDGNRSVFHALVTNDNGAIAKGDLLVANKGGTLTKATEGSSALAYAMPLSDLNDPKGKIKVKLLSR